MITDRGDRATSEIILVCTAGAAFVSLVLSIVSLLVHYSKRGEHPLLVPLEAEINALKAGQLDLVDRVEHWMKRDRARRVREAVDESPPVPTPMPELSEHERKRQIREVARQRGLVK